MKRMAAKVVINLHIAYRRSLARDKVGADYDSAGRVDYNLIRSFMAIPEAHYLFVVRRRLWLTFRMLWRPTTFHLKASTRSRSDRRHDHEINAVGFPMPVS